MPVKIERAYKKRLLQRQLVRQRDAEHEAQGLRRCPREGLEVRAQRDDLSWYSAVIDECCDDGSFAVTFADYDDAAVVSIDQIQLPHRHTHRRSKSRRRHRRR